MKQRGGRSALVLAVWAAGACCAGAAWADRTKNIRGSLGTFNSAPRAKDGRVDHQRLLGELEELGANTYNWTVWHAPTDWEDLKVFLPLAAEKQIKVWATVPGPNLIKPEKTSGCPAPEPFKNNYYKWSEAFARLSVDQPGLVAWGIDDFSHRIGGRRTFRLEVMKQISQQTRAINDALAFVPCAYLSSIRNGTLREYAPYVDGVVFPYRAESRGWNLKDPGLVATELGRFKGVMGRDFPVIVEVYSTGHSKLGTPSAQYVGQVIANARSAGADGMHIYCHPDRKTMADKYQATRAGFHAWRK